MINIKYVSEGSSSYTVQYIFLSPSPITSSCYLLQVRDELEQLLDDDDDMADLYLSRKAGSVSPVSGSGAANWFATSPTNGSKISRASRASIATARFDENDVEELEMLLEVITLLFSSKCI